ncbi:hypothetical protein [Pseudonocardia humida]|uniref:NYN domain-containing protein n=1 Tax=Pseudonocardia humida TaxID=2800819 RepID=A0ABT0ZTU8_9PSEU|nr:hypothetical protein [Pseudonocardia humida]MCO1654162.1 hypothetical protein [Pseudonocardia humida]
MSAPGVRRRPAVRTAWVFRAMSDWPAWSGRAAAVWSFAYGGLGLHWSLGGDGFPFAPVDPDRASGSVLEGAPVGVVAPVMAVLGLLGGVVGLVTARRAGSGWPRTAVLVFGWTVAAGLTLVVPDYSLLALLAFAPVLAVFAFTGIPGDQDGLGDILYWHRTNLVVLFVGGLLWAAATLAHQRRTRGACAHCGRRDGTHGRGPSPAALLRWGRWAVVVALLAPLPYEVTRIAWYLGFPLGISDDFLRMMQGTPGMLEVGLGCAIASALGGVLTHGLVRRWGEVYPRWVRFRAGRPVPPALAVVPAAIVAVVLVPAGLMNVRAGFSADSWGLNLPSALWVVWGVALGAATLAYHLRRRGACRRCGRT